MTIGSRLMIAMLMLGLLTSAVTAQTEKQQKMIELIQQGLKTGTLISQVEAMVAQQNENQKASPSAVTRLLNQLAVALEGAGAYQTGVALASETLRYAEAKLGPDHPNTLSSMNNLAGLHESQGHYEKAEPLFEKALSVREQTLGKDHPDTLSSMNNLAGLYSRQGRYEKAESLFKEVLSASERTLGKDHRRTLTSKNNLAFLYFSLGRYSEAEPLFKEALSVRERISGKDHPDNLMIMNNLAFLYFRQGRYGEAEPLFERTISVSERALGKDHPQTLQSVNNLALLYSNQGRYSEAEPIFKQTLSASERALGKDHPRTLASVNNLAELYSKQGRYGEAEPLFKRAMSASERALGEDHPQTLTSLNNLAGLYFSQGRYGEAEPLFKRAMSASERALGGDHPQTLGSVNNLAELYSKQGRYDEAEPLFKQAMLASERALGEDHPRTLGSVNNLALLYLRQDRYSEAEPLYQRALSASERALGKNHPQTLGSVSNLAGLYLSQGRYGEAEPLYQRALSASEQALGEDHPQTLGSMNSLAFLYSKQGRYGEAELLFKRALPARERVLGKDHPDTLTTHMNFIALLIEMNQANDALQSLQRFEPRLFTFAALQLQTTTQQWVRRQFLLSQSTFQDVVFTLAAQQPSPSIHTYAAGVVLRWKRLQADEDAYMTRLIRHATDPKLKEMGQRLVTLRSQFSHLLNSPSPDSKELRQRLDHLEAQEAALAAYSRRYKNHLRARDVRLNDVRTQLPANSGLLELRLYHPVDFKTGKSGTPHFVALLLPAVPVDDQAYWLVDLGPVSEIKALLKKLRRNYSRQVAQQLYQRLFGQLDTQLAQFDTLYIAPDSLLHQAAFSRLVLPDGSYWFQRQQLRRIHTGRDLIPQPRHGEAKGMVAIGGMDYDTYPAPAAGSPSVTQTAGEPLHTAQQHSASQSFVSGFPRLTNSGPEAAAIAAAYREHTKIEPQVWQGAAASEAKLKALPSPPYVLHLATHGFYLSNPPYSRELPMAKSGVALAGANRGMAGHQSPASQDGILYALEVQNLNLEGTELVTLSACDTGQGVLDYSDGVYGLTRAFRIAGSRNVLMTLWRVGDDSAKDFMERFYGHWFAGGMKDAALALDQTRRDFLEHDYILWQDSKVWAPFVLVESR